MLYPNIILVALGGNALVRKGERGRFNEQVANLSKIASHLVDLSRRYILVVTHGNGPQVGALYLQQETVKDVPLMPLHACVAMTQSLIGYMIQEALNDIDPSLSIAVCTTRVLVDPSDPAFKKPSKPIGPYYSREEAEELQRKRGWVFVEIPGRGFRRVVPSPKPLKIVDLPVVKSLLGKVDVIVAGGGGGIPVIRYGNGFKGVDAVIDKDHLSSLLAVELNAELLAILTDVDGVYLDYGKPSQRLLKKLTVDEAEKLLDRDVFPPGSMGPKVEAAVKFVLKTGRPAVIGNLKNLKDVVKLKKGTIIEP